MVVSQARVGKTMRLEGGGGYARDEMSSTKGDQLGALPKVSPTMQRMKRRRICFHSQMWGAVWCCRFPSEVSSSIYF